MKVFLPLKRATLLCAPEPDEAKKHLFILITDPSNYPSDGDSDHSLIVSVSSIKKYREYDESCRLYKGDHPFITRDSYISYYHSKILPTKTLIEGCNQKHFTPQEALDSQIFARVCKGLDESDFVTPKIRNFYNGFHILP